MLAINIKEKKFTQETLLQNIAVNINKPGIFGLVGKNGHGKTTLFKCALGLEKFTGNCTLNSENIKLYNVAWCPTEPSVYNELTSEEFYDFYRKLLAIKKDKTDVDNLLFDVPKDKLIREFSTGMKKKVYLNAVFQKVYPVYFLDEPFNGLDLESNHRLIQFLKKQSEKSIIIISSHIMEILYSNCLEIFVLNNKTVLKFEKQNFDLIEGTLFA
jgi:ABC-2 type transport system ATP-binding protein